MYNTTKETSQPKTRRIGFFQEFRISTKQEGLTFCPVANATSKNLPEHLDVTSVVPLSVRFCPKTDFFLKKNNTRKLSPISFDSSVIVEQPWKPVFQWMWVKKSKKNDPERQKNALFYRIKKTLFWNFPNNHGGNRVKPELKTDD